MILDTTAKVVELILGEVKTANDCEFTADWSDTASGATFVPGNTVGLTNGTTLVTAVAAPAASTQRHVKFLSVFNADTVTHAIIVRIYDGTNRRRIVNFSVAAGATLEYSSENGFAISNNSGTVTSVAMTVPARQTVAGSPITSSGTLAVTDNNQNANLVFAGPGTGSAAAPAFRALVSADIAGLATPGGSTTNIQVNDAGAFYGAAGLTYTKTTGVVTVGQSAATIGNATLDISPTITAQTVNLTSLLNISPAITTSSNMVCLAVSPTIVQSSSTALARMFVSNPTVVNSANTASGCGSFNCIVTIGPANTGNRTGTGNSGMYALSGTVAIASGNSNAFTIAAMSVVVGQINLNSTIPSCTNSYGTNFLNPVAAGTQLGTHCAHYTATPTTAVNNIGFGIGTLTTGNFAFYDGSSYNSKFGGAVGTGIYTVATLPSAPGDGYHAYVTDALAPTFLGAIVGGGTVHTPVYYNAGTSAWTVG